LCTVSTRLLFLLLSFALLAPLGRSQADLHRTSTIETIVGGETTTGNGFSLFSVSGLAADSRGNIYFSMQAKNEVFRLAMNGQVTIFAGNGTREKQIDGVLAADSPLPDPRSLAIDGADNVYIICGNGLVRGNGNTQRIRRVRMGAQTAQCHRGVETVPSTPN
jgi:hypothetical protein